METLPKALIGVHLLHRIVTYPVDKVVRSLNNCALMCCVNGWAPGMSDDQLLIVEPEGSYPAYQAFLWGSVRFSLFDCAEIGTRAGKTEERELSF